MIRVVFHGSLKQFGEEYQLDVNTPAEVIRALCLQIPGIEAHIKAHSWHVVRGSLDNKDSITEDALEMPFGNQRELHFIPAIEGSNNGIVNTIIGVVLVVAGFMTANPALMAAGVGMMIGGIVMMTMKVPQTDLDQSSVDEKASFLLGKPTNSTKQGVAIPRGYGRAIIGSIVVSSSVTAEQLLEGEESEGLPDTDQEGWPYTG